MKKLFAILCLLALTFGLNAATIKFYHEMPLSNTLSPGMLLSFENEQYNNYAYAPLSTLRTWLGGTPGSSNVTFYINSNYVTIQFVTNLYANVQYVTNFNGKNTYIQNSFITNLYANYITNEYSYTTNQYVTFNTNLYSYVTNQYVTFNTNLYSYVTNQYVTFNTNQYSYVTNQYVTYNTNLYSYVTNLTVNNAFISYLTNEYFYTTNVYASYVTNNFLYVTNAYISYLTNNYQYTTNLYVDYITNNLAYITNLYVNNTYINNGLFTNNVFFWTNSWAGPSNPLPMYLASQDYLTFTPCSITGLSGRSNYVAQSVLLTITNAASTNITVYLPADMRTGDGARSYIITNATLGMFSVQYNPNGGRSNCVFRLFY